MSVVSSSLLASVIASFTLAAPPDAPADPPAEPAPPAEQPEPANPSGEPDAKPAPDGAAPKGFVPGPVDPAKGLPRDERNDPVLPYGEPSSDAGLEYADETPPAPELEYAADTPPAPELGYDQARQRTPPNDEALARESDLEDSINEDEFQGRQESPQRFAVEIKFGPYSPDVDRNYTGSGFGPYATIYGKTDEFGNTIDQPKKGIFSVFGFEWQFFHAGGPLSVGTTIGYFRDSADALIEESVDEGESVRSSADKTVFHVIPITLLLGYRFELLADRFNVPLVPYARGGVATGFWIEKKGGKLVTNEAGQQSRGNSWGWQANLGLMLRLDFIDRAQAVDLDRMTKINHTYVFGEWQFSRLNNFGSESAMSIGDDTFLIGLAVAF